VTNKIWKTITVNGTEYHKLIETKYLVKGTVVFDVLTGKYEVSIYDNINRTDFLYFDTLEEAKLCLEDAYD